MTNPNSPRHAATSTQGKYPWRAVVRTVFEVAIAAAVIAPLVIGAAGITGPAVAGFLAVTAAITRVMALPQVNVFLRKYAPWLADAPASALEVGDA
ncbi:hypothetical protein EDD28_0082 [Salana multivorans]|uniref:Uncharacterized protein n=1 Tax=Salana multivorans TaxID=120377 RepID=A0A3N2D6W5_9MICO|nr:hypothetical protein [Salana multivorans]ROR95526.1 hypothetical protein EDD28_0082 [Salana multivorans]